MSVENLQKEFEAWNPMVNDFKNVEFNKYCNGPGANLELAGQSGNAPVPYLMFKNMPRNMTTTAVYNICSKHGKVIEVRSSQKNDYYFADFATIADMESAFRALENNNYGFTVIVGRNKKPTNPNDYNKENNTNVFVPPRTTGIDYQNRTYVVNAQQKQRPKIQMTPLVGTVDINGISADIFNNDAHELERKGCFTPVKNDKFKYHTGRSYVAMNGKTKDFINKKHTESTGAFSGNTDQYVGKIGTIENPSYVGKCVLCERTSDLICSRCSSYYCSMECQKNDWKRHRQICGKPIHIQRMFQKPETQATAVTESSKIHNKQNAVAPTDVDYIPKVPRSGSIVTITAVTKTNIVFIRSRTYEDNMDYFKTVDGLQALGKKLKPLTTMPKCGNVVVGKFENKYNRALVLNAKNPEEIFLNYMDYGNLDSVQLKDLYEVPEGFAHKPRHAQPVMLKNVPNCYMTDGIRNFMYSYLNGINVCVKYKPEDYDKEKQVYQVELIDEATQQNLNKMINTIARPTEPKSTKEVCYKDCLEYKKLSCGENIELIIMDNSVMSSGCISCTTTIYAKEIQKFHPDIQNYVKGVPKEGYAPRVDELCIAKFKGDNEWYRGRCVEIVGDAHPTILFIDYGNLDIIHIDDIRRYPSQFTYPVYTADCEIKGLPESPNEEIVKKLNELISNGSIIKCKKVEELSPTDHFYSLSLPNVIEKLTECGLL